MQKSWSKLSMNLLGTIWSVALPELGSVENIAFTTSAVYSDQFGIMVVVILLIFVSFYELFVYLFLFLICMSNIWIYVIGHVHLASWPVVLHGKNFNVGHYSLSVVCRGTIDLTILYCF